MLIQNQNIHAVPSIPFGSILILSSHLRLDLPSYLFSFPRMHFFFRNICAICPTHHILLDWSFYYWVWSNNHEAPLCSYIQLPMSTYLPHKSVCLITQQFSVRVLCEWRIPHAVEVSPSDTSCLELQRFI